MSLTSGFSHPENKDLAGYTHMAKSLVLALRKIPLYPSGHPIIKGAISKPYELVSGYLGQTPELTLGVKEDALLFENLPLETTELWTKNFVSDLKKLNIQSITFDQGLTMDGLEQFLRILSTSPDQVKAKGGLKALLSKGKVTHIRVNQILYEKVTEGKKIGPAVELEGMVKEKPPGPAVSKKDEIEQIDPAQIIARYLSGRLNSLNMDKALFIEKVKADTKGIAGLVWRQVPGRKTEKRLLDLLTKNFKAAGCPEEESLALASEVMSAFPKKAPSKLRVKPGELKEVSADLLEENTKLKEKLASLEEQLKLKTGTETQLKQDNRRLAREKERVDAVIHNIGHGLVVVDDEGKVLLMNPAAEKLLGTTQKEEVGKDLLGTLKEEHLLALSKAKGAEGPEAVTGEIELVSPQDETRKIIQASTAVVENKNGKTIGMVSVLHDITKQKELDELKSRFVSLVSHELRTPLVAIDKNMSVLLEGMTGEIKADQHRFLSAAKRNVERLSRLINDLLDLSKIEAGKLGLSIQTVELNKIIQEVVSTLKVWAEDKKIQLQMKLSEQIPVFEADPDRLAQVLNNLMGNAIKFTPEGGRIEVSSILKDKVSGLEGERFVQVDVRDSGIGIAEADRERIFDKFEQVSLISPAGIGGTGLGLPISREIIQMHSGRIWVEISPGEGSTFSFTLPLSRQKVKSE